MPLARIQTLEKIFSHLQCTLKKQRRKLSCLWWRWWCV